MKILGIDPGYDKCGLAVAERNSGREIILFSTCLRTNPKIPLTERLLAIGKEVEKIIDIYQPQEVAIENVFFTNNQKTAAAVSEVRGMLCYIACRHNLLVTNYTPLQIKTTIAGYGAATKEQVALMVSKLVKLTKTISEDDEFDAIAIALTHLARRKSLLISK